MGGCDICNLSAAFDIFSSSAITRKKRRLLESMLTSHIILLFIFCIVLLIIYYFYPMSNDAIAKISILTLPSTYTENLSACMIYLSYIFSQVLPTVSKLLHSISVDPDT